MNLTQFIDLRQFHRKVGTRVVATLVLTALLAIGSMFLTDLWLGQISQSNAQAVNAYRKVFYISNIRRLARVAESSQRGYLISSKEDYLQPYEGAKKDIRIEFDKLHTEIASVWSTPSENESYNRLNYLLGARLLEMDMVLKLAQNNQRTEAINLLQTDQGLRLQQEFSAQSAEFESQLRNQLSALSNERSAKIKWARLTIILTILTLSGVIVYTINSLIKAILDKERAKDQLNEENQTYQRKLNENLQLMQSLVLDAQTDIENNRYQLSRDLHDELGSILTAIKMDLNWSSKKLKDSQPEVYDKLQRTMGYLDRAIVFKRQVVEELHPSMLKSFGLWAALESLAQDTAERNQWQLTLSLPETPAPISEALQLVIYRVVQETLNNAAKYAQAQHFILDIDQQQEAIKIEMSDDGVGTDLNQIKTKAHGIVGIKNRIFAAGGKIHIESALGKGMKTQILLPVINEPSSKSSV